MRSIEEAMAVSTVSKSAIKIKLALMLNVDVVQNTVKS